MKMRYGFFISTYCDDDAKLCTRTIGTAGVALCTMLMKVQFKREIFPVIKGIHCFLVMSFARISVSVQHFARKSSIRTEKWGYFLLDFTFS